MTPDESAAPVRDLNPPTHVMPTGDQIEHTLDADCVCGPRMEAVKRDDGSVGWLCSHHSLDGREVDE